MKRIISLLILLAIICGSATAEGFSFGPKATEEPQDGVVVAFEAEQYSIMVGKTQTIKPIIQGYNGKSKFSYKTSDKAIATVNESGTVKGIKAGKATISCSVTTDQRTYDVSYTLNVNQPVKKIIIEAETTNLHSNGQYELKVTVLPEDATVKDIDWSSSNSSVATVDKNNVLHGHFVGSATLTATAKDGSGVKATLKVKIPRVSFAEKNITIDSPDGAILTYWQNSANGISIISSGSTGKCFTTASIQNADPWNTVENKVKLIPLKVGSGKFVVSVNGTRFSVNVKVTRNAVYEEGQYSSFGKNKSLVNQRFSVTGRIIDVVKTENDYKVTILVAEKNGQYAVVSLPFDKWSTRLKVDAIVTVKGIFDSMTEYTATNGLSYNVPHFITESINVVNQ